jgi:hypothetical protein
MKTPPQPARPIRPLLPLLVTAALACAGCMPGPGTQTNATRIAPEASAPVAAAPRQLVEDVKRVVTSPPLSFELAEARDGVVATGWKRYRGDWHIGRYWQERTRYRVEVIPDWNEPTSATRLRVTAETEQRAAAGQRWDREPRVPRPQRAQEVLGQILSQLPRSEVTR